MPSYQQPPYPAGFTPQTFTPNRPLVLWANETVAAGGKSVQFGIRKDQHFPAIFSLEAVFSADPGAFSLSIQTADVDDETRYVTKVTLSDSTLLNSSFVGRIEVMDVVAKFARAYLSALTNAVNITATVY
jgi:hypothetical protein